MRAESDGLDPERRLALAYAPASRRPALATLWRLDAALGALVGTASQPMVAQMKLAWWREALGRLDNAPPPAEPLLQAVAASLPAIGRGAAIARLADGWEFLAADDDLRAEDFQGFAEERGARLFRLSAQCLGSEPVPGLEAAGRCWALIDLARHASKASERDAALAAAAAEREQLPERWPKGLRPLGMLTVLAARDGERAMLAPVASPSRMLRMLAHRLSGR